MSKRGLATAMLVASAIALAGVFFLLQRSLQRPPSHKLLVIFPFIEKAPRDYEKNARGYAITSQGLAFAEQLTAQLRQRRAEEVSALPVQSLFELANHDSLHVPEYVLRLAKGAGVHFVGLGVYGGRGNANAFEAQFQLFDEETEQPILQHTFAPSPEAFAELSRGVCAALEVETESALSQAAPTKSEAYYALALRFLREEDIAAEAALLARSDTTDHGLAELYARATLRRLRERRAHEKEWNDSLEVLLPALQRALRRDSLGLEAALLLAQCYLQQKKWNEADKVLRRCRESEARHSKSFVYLAQLHSSRFETEGFIDEGEIYRHALTLNPFDVDAALGAASFARMNMRKQDAFALLTKYHRLNPDHLAVLRTLGRFYVMDSDMANVLKTYEHIIRLDAQDANAFYNLGIAYFHQKDYANAERFFERAVTLDNHADARLYLAHIAEQRGELEKSIAYLRERIRLSTGDDDAFAAEARKQLYKTLLRRGEIPKHLLPDTTKKN